MFDSTISGSKAPAATENNPVELVQGPNGQVEKPLSKLSSGDHTVQFEDGRQFLVHVPKAADTSTAELPAMFVFSGSAEPQYNIKDFSTESGMNGVADEDPKHPFVVVYPLMKEHKLGVYSTQPAWGFNAPGSMLDKQDFKNAGYNDVDYVHSIVDLMPKIANVDPTHKDWGAVGFSQGGVFLNDLISGKPTIEPDGSIIDQKGWFPSLGLIGTSMVQKYKYTPQEGNAKNVMIVELLGDKITLPIRGLTTQSLKYDKDLIERFFLHDLNIGKFHGKAVIEGTDPLAAFHNENQSPMKQNRIYTAELGHKNKDYTVTRTDLSTPTESPKKKDFEIDYVPKDPSDHNRVTVFGLIKAQHAYPAPLYGDPPARTNATTKYTQFDASRHFAQLFDQYNDAIKKDAEKGALANH